MKLSDRLSVDEIETLQFRQFKEYLAQVLAGSTYYARKFRELGLEASDIASWSDTSKLPALDTATLLANNADLVAVPRERLRRVMVSGGTTGTPKVCYLADGIRDIVKVWAAAWQVAELDRNDVVAVLCPLPLASGIVITEMLEEIGCTTIPLGLTTPPQFAAQLMERLSATVIATQPSTLGRFADELGLLGREPRSFAIRKIFLGSEVLTPKIRRQVESEWGAEVFDTSGSSEVGMIGSECKEHDGHHLAVASAYFEVVDGETGARVKEGVGRLYVTTLMNLGLPLLRYDMKDVVRITHEPCRCGRTSPRIWFLGRADDRVTLKTGVKLCSYQIDEALAAFEVGSLAYNVIVTGDDRHDAVKFVMELPVGAAGDAELRAGISRAIIRSSVDFDEIYRAGLVSAPEVEFVSLGTLERTARGKIRDRFRDLRTTTHP